jgi:uncharacterized protein
MNETPEPLPTFKYFPDPIASGVIEPSTVVCRACNLPRGHIYTGPVRTGSDLDLHDALCPWCIADGTAHTTFGTEFAEYVGNEAGHKFDPVPTSVRDEVLYRTPRFYTWQYTMWSTHCGDGAAFHGHAGYPELTGAWKDAVPVIRSEGDWEEDDEEWEELLRILDRDSCPTAYVFRCLHCGALGGYWDMD